jgi:VWFA-related protein
MKKLFLRICVCIFLLALTSTIVNAQSSLNLIINNILVAPKPENVSYEVKAYLSVLDSTGVPVTDLKADNFSVIEDSHPMTVETVTQANDPISVIMALDTSGSMVGSAVKSAKDAANSLLLGMSSDDQVSILSFNSTVKPVIDFTKDRQSAGQQLSLLDATPGSGTCLYNAAYQAVQNVAALPPGRRAVILFTDGVDDNGSGKPCSTYTIDDVIHLATGGSSPIPIYTLGMGNHVDQQSLQRLASLTGGRFQYAPSSDQLGAIFKNLSDLLKSQYLLTYSTTSAQGSHTVVITATTSEGTAKDTRNFISPAMPAGIMIKSPNDGQSISGKQVISAVLIGDTTGIQQVVFYVGGKEVGQATVSPYDLNFDFTSNFSGNTSIDVVAQGASGEIIAKQTINVNVIAPTTVPGATPTISSVPAASTTSKTTTTTPFHIPSLYLMVGGIGLLVVIIVVAIIFVVRKRKSKGKGNDSGIGSLEVIFSDDKMFLGKKFEIVQPITKLGKLITDNDISFPSDSPVSKHHAIIEKKGRDLYIREVPQGTTYGTYVMGSKVGTTPVQLNNNDEIRLGNRLKLKLKLLNASGEQTLDNFVIQGEDKTIDHIPSPKESFNPFDTQDPEN